MKYITELVSFGLAVPLLLYAGLSPLLEGRPAHVPFLLLGVISLGLFVFVWTKARRNGGPGRR